MIGEESNLLLVINFKVYATVIHFYFPFQKNFIFNLLMVNNLLFLLKVFNNNHIIFDYLITRSTTTIITTIHHIDISWLSGCTSARWCRVHSADVARIRPSCLHVHDTWFGLLVMHHVKEKWSMINLVWLIVELPHVYIYVQWKISYLVHDRPFILQYRVRTIRRPNWSDYIFQPIGDNIHVQ